MNSVILEAKPIVDIKGNFFVPKYQRGINVICHLVPVNQSLAGAKPVTCGG